MIIGIHGHFGSMKTVTGVALAKIAEESGYKVVSNQPLNFPYIKLDMEMLRRYTIIGEPLPYGDKVFILGDEWQQVMDSRRSMDGDELINSYMITQTRKRGIRFAYISSLRGMNDIRLRDNTDIIFKCYKRHRGPNNEIGNICYDDECERNHLADWYIINVQANRGVHRCFMNPEVIYKLFDTNHIISPISHLNEEEMQGVIKAIKSGM